MKCHTALFSFLLFLVNVILTNFFCAVCTESFQFAFRCSQWRHFYKITYFHWGRICKIGWYPRLMFCYWVWASFPMMTPPNGNIWRVTGPLCGEFTGHRWIPLTKAMFFFDLRLNKRMSKQSWGWWFETPSHSLWRHRNANEFSWYPEAPRVLNMLKVYVKTEHILILLVNFNNPSHI